MSFGEKFSAWRDRVVPVTVERMAGEIDGGQLGADFEAGVGCGRGDQLDNCTIASQRLAAPVDGDEREETMLDLVPLAGAGRQVANRDRQLELVRQFLKFDLPEAHTIAVAAAAV